MGVGEGNGAPDLRLVLGVGPPGAFAKGLTGPNVRLVAPNIPNELQGVKTLLQKSSNNHSLPALLVSYVYLREFLLNRERYYYRNYVLDSGAYSAYNSGTEVNLQHYIDICKELIDRDSTLVEIYSLDVIGDWRATLKNTEEMWRQGVPAIPCYHYGEPWSVLRGLARDYPKIALGGVAKMPGIKIEWAERCFARIYPKKIHGFSYGTEKAILTIPFHSVDASNWEIGPCKFGTWRAFGKQKVSVRGSNQNLRAEVEWWLALEEKARTRWKGEMEKLESITPTTKLTICNGDYNTNCSTNGKKVV